MTTKNFGEIKAVAFDIDGTLYKEIRLHFRMSFYFLCHSVFFLHYGLARKKLRKDEAVPDFYAAQAECMAQKLKCTVEEVSEKLSRVIYDGLKDFFQKIKPCKHAQETIAQLKNAGFKIALLSDFPPEQKGDVWGIKPYCDVILGTENCGALKPSPVPFHVLSKELGIAPEEILYVGNNFKYDVVGSKRTGMKAAWFVSRWKYIFQKKNKTADFVFCDYRKLLNAILK